MGWPNNTIGTIEQNIPFANITSAPNLAGCSTVIFGDLTGNAVTPTPINGVIGKTYDFIWHQDGTGGRNVTFDGVDYGSGAADKYMTKSFKCVAANTFVLVGSS